MLYNITPIFSRHAAGPAAKWSVCYQLKQYYKLRSKNLKGSLSVMNFSCYGRWNAYSFFVSILYMPVSFPLRRLVYSTVWEEVTLFELLVGQITDKALFREPKLINFCSLKNLSIYIYF